MTRLYPSQLQEGMILARSIVADDGRVLLKGGTRLRQSYINRLQFLEIPAVYVLENDEEYAARDVVAERTRAQAVAQVRDAFSAVAIGRPLNLRAIQEAVDNLLDEILATRSPVLGLAEIRTFDAYTFSHSANVCIISLLLGLRCRLPMRELRELGIGALLHDIGKLHVPREILNKPGHLNQEELSVMRAHTKRGYDHLRACPDLNLLSALVAWQHHERIDASGYPLGLAGERIHIYSQIVMVADVYDAMTSDRVYRRGLPPVEALHHLQSLRGISFSSDVVDALAQIVSPYPYGARVLLNTGEIARVIEVNPTLLDRPKVRVLKTNHPDRLSVPFEIDLQRDLSRSISRVIHDEPTST